MRHEKSGAAFDGSAQTVEKATGGAGGPEGPSAFHRESASPFGHENEATPLRSDSLAFPLEKASLQDFPAGSQRRPGKPCD